MKKLKLTREWTIEGWFPFNYSIRKVLFWTKKNFWNWKHLVWVKTTDGREKDKFYVDGKLFMIGKIIGKPERLTRDLTQKY